MIFKKYTFPEFQDPVGTLPVLHSKEFQEVFSENNNKLLPKNLMDLIYVLTIILWRV